MTTEEKITQIVVAAWASSSCEADTLYNSIIAVIQSERDRAKAELAEVTAERDALTDRIDLMRDEFKRILALTHSCVDWYYAEEVRGVCGRAISDIAQHVPVIAQRDEAIKEQDRLRAALDPFARVADDLDPELWSDDQILFAQGNGVSVRHVRAAREAVKGH